MNLYLGIDIGTTKICVLALNSKTGKPAFSASEQNNSNVSTGPVFYQQDPEKIKKTVLRLIGRAVEKTEKKISGIGLTGQMHGMLFVDRRLRPLSKLITWQDQRATGLITEIRKKAGRSAGECGCAISPGYLGATLYWFTKNKKVPNGAYKACFIHDWIATLLTKEKQLFTDPTDAAGSGLFNFKKNQWHWDLIDKLGLNRGLFPEIRASGEIIGYTGSGIPVHCAIGDNQASALGSGAGAGSINVNIGTGSQVSVITDKFVKPSGPLELRPYFNGKYLLVGRSLKGGAVYARLKRKLGITYEEMNRRAEKPGPCRRTLEAMAKSLHSLYLRAGINKHKLCGSGNAIKKNPVLRDIISKTFKMKLNLPSHDEEAAWGAALLVSVKKGPGKVKGENRGCPPRGIS